MNSVRASIAVFVVALFLVGLFGIAKSFGAAAGLARSHSGGGVTVKVTYVDPQAADELRFEVVLDTHSVNLDGYDLKALSQLRYKAGKTYEPTKIESKGSGHHREIVLGFPKPSPEAKRLELVIRDIAGVKERTFRWDLQ